MLIAFSLREELLGSVILDNRWFGGMLSLG